LQAAYDNVYEKMSDKKYRRRCLIDAEYGFDVTKTDSLVSPFLGTLDYKFRFDWEMPEDSKESADTFGTIVVVFALQEAKWMLKTFTVPGGQEHSVGNSKAREQQPWHNDAIVLAAEATTRGEAITSLLDEAGYKARKERFEAALHALAEKVAAHHLELERSNVALLERQVAFWKGEESRLEQVLDSARKDRWDLLSRYRLHSYEVRQADSAVESAELEVGWAKRRRDVRQKLLVQCQKVLVTFSGRLYPAIVKGQIRQVCLDPSSWVTRALTDGTDVDTWEFTRLHQSKELYQNFSISMERLREQKEVDDTSHGRVRSWRDGDKTIEAEFVRYDGKDVLLKGTDGKRIRLSGGSSLPDAVRLWIAELPESAESSEVDGKQRPPQPHAQEAAAETSARAKLEEAEAQFKELETRLSERYRTWQDTSAKFTVVAEYNGYKDGNVTLTRQEDGREISLPLAQLSEPDRKWVRKQLQSKATAVAPGGSRAEKAAGLRRVKEAHERLASVLDEIAARRAKRGATDSAPDTLQAEANQQRQRASELEAAIKKLEN